MTNFNRHKFVSNQTQNMKRNASLLVILVAVFSAVLFLSFKNGIIIDELAINALIPEADYKMKEVSGKTVSLNDIKKAKGLLVIFSCNTCPYVKMSESRIKEYSDFALTNGVGCILVNSNEAQRGEDDSFDEMTKYYSAQKLKCAYALDEKSQLANAFGASRTPQCFLFNNKGLIYKGAIDDNVKDPSAVKAAYLKEALAALLKNETPKTQETKSIGCTIKRAD
jgi:thioredoxin-related protein